MPVSAARLTDTISEEDQLRARLYRLLGHLLARPPETETLSALAVLGGDSSELGGALTTLAKLAGATSVFEADREFHNLFIGVGRGELVPFASYYLTGFLNERPLALLRQDMARLGIEREADVKEPEDHVGALCEMMAGLIEGSFGAPADLDDQRRFFDAHIGRWAGKFFEDLEAAKTSCLYAPVGTIGRIYMDIEATAFGMVDDPSAGPGSDEAVD
ncbi:MAG: molecular chaperone TorD family protein [Inquilinus sp.]|nr:molecular chaperone TorD family protein [Inquilinus sp.]